MTIGPKLAAALVSAQAELRAVGKDSVNPHFKNRYASLDNIIEAIRPVLANHRLAVVQSAEGANEGKALNVLTILLHESGESISSAILVPLAKLDPQGAGGALTYGRRYGLSALLCLATEDDDDGNTAARPVPRQQARSGEQSARPTSAPASSSVANAETSTATASTPSAQGIPDENVKMGGKPLREYTDDELKKVVAKKGVPIELVRACRNVLAARALDLVPF